MNDQELQAWVERISLACFNRPFLHRAAFNRKLRSTGGRYLTRTHDIEISWRQWESFGREEVEKIIKHELCHYHLHLQKKGYRHRDADFKMWLAKVGGSRYCKALPEAHSRKRPFKYRLVCKSCGREYFRKRKVNTRKYACGLCGGRLKQYELQPSAGPSIP